jgi:hypothetical protein
MARFLLNPTFDIETGKLLSHDGEFFEELKILFDRGAQQQAKNLGQQAGGVAGSSQANANQERSTIIPGLEREAQTPMGFTPEQTNKMLVASQEGAGGGNAALTGEGRLAALRTRTAGGFAPALDEAARVKNRTLASNALDVQNQNARLGLQRQDAARRQLEGLYGTDTSNMLRAMGLQNEDLSTQLAAGRQGWWQNLNQGLQTAGKMGAGAIGVG